MKNLLVVGAGFSRNAGLPLASQFTRALIDVRRLSATGPSARQLAYIRKFVDDVFGEGVGYDSEQWPELEDIFTLVDLSANTGHHLGRAHSASDLRVVRRAIIVRMIRMLAQAERRGLRDRSVEWRTLERFFARFDLESSAVLSMNWDTVFERGIARTQDVHRVDYGCGATAARFNLNRLVMRRLSGSSLTLVKPHGSVNWLYCDACRDTFWVPPNETEQVAQTLFRRKDWEAIGAGSSRQKPSLLPRCPRCRSQSLGTRFATFSYRKALDFPMHAASWRTAEQLLRDADNWVFFGYSMPAADFEFKHLLKRVQLIKDEPPRILLVTGGGDAQATATRFTKFFGQLDATRDVFLNGLDIRARNRLSRIGLIGASTSAARPTS